MDLLLWFAYYLYTLYTSSNKDLVSLFMINKAEEVFFEKLIEQYKIPEKEISYLKLFPFDVKTSSSFIVRYCSTRPTTVPAGSDHYFHTCWPAGTKLKNQNHCRPGLWAGQVDH